jgi:hypothetical protein
MAQRRHERACVVISLPVARNPGRKSRSRGGISKKFDLADTNCKTSTPVALATGVK